MFLQSSDLRQTEKHWWPRVFLLGLLVSFAALCPAILPYGGRFVTRGDFLEQQLPFLLEARRILRSGLNAYSFNTFLGAPALGSYAFYTLGSPFVWPLALLPEAALPFAISVMAVLKLACAVTFAALWLTRLVRDRRAALLCAVLYAFSSFSVVNTQFYHFWEVIAFFPLILWGMEVQMSDAPRPGVLGLCCGLNALTNYYFMASSAALAGLYFCFRFFSPDWKRTRSLGRCFAVVFECAVGCGLAGVLLLPALRFMMTITRTGGSETPLWARHYSLPELAERLRSLLMPIESSVVHAWIGTAPSWSSTACCLPVFGFCGALVFLAHPDGQRWLRRLLLVLLLISCVPVLSGAFALWTNLSYTRWWYGLAALQALAVGYALTAGGARPFALPEKARLRCWGIAFLLPSLYAAGLVLAGLLPEELLSGTPAAFLLKLRAGAFASGAFRALSLGLSLLGGAALLFLLVHRPGWRAALAVVCLCAAVNFAAYIAAGDSLLLSGGTEAGQGRYTTAEIAEPTLSAIGSGSGWKRIDYGTRLRNYSLILGCGGLTSFQSLRSSTVGRFITAAGFGYDESTTVTPPDASGALRALLSVTEYHQTDPDDPVPEGFVYDREENGFAVYVNPNAVPMGFLQTAAVHQNAARLRREILPETLLNYAVLDEEAFALAGDALGEGDPKALTGWAERASQLQEQACDRFEVFGDGFEAHIDAAATGLLVFTIPYDKGFTAEVDGVPAQVVPCDISFMGVLVSPGSHTIRFRYHTRGLLPGIALTLLSAAVLCGWAVYWKRKRK